MLFVKKYYCDDAEQKIKHIWNNIGANYPEEERIDDSELKINISERSNMICFAITLPIPISPNELHYSFIVADKNALESVRLFGLEKGRLPTVLVEWNKIGRITYDINIDPVLNNLEDAVFNILENKVEIITFSDLRPLGWFSPQSQI
jgi:hypothetical protein